MLQAFGNLTKLYIFRWLIAAKSLRFRWKNEEASCIHLIIPHLFGNIKKTIGPIAIHLY